MEHSLNISQLAGIKNFSTEFSALGNEYIFSHLTSASRPTQSQSIRGPLRIDGPTWILCRRGRMTVNINLNHCELTDNMLLVAPPDSIFEVGEHDRENIDAYLFFVSPEFMRNTNIDPNVVFSLPITHQPDRPPVLRITEAESDLLGRYFELVHLNTSGNTDDLFVRSISRCLISAMCYQVIQFVMQRANSDDHPRPGTRRATYVGDFMRLVHAHHRQERSVGFYADKLFISPKYLSMIVKEVTGRSAAEWIDELVLLEAKNLLRFSGKSIQQIAYELNFPNQSSFGKYFKHLTGLSPSQYQHS